MAKGTEAKEIIIKKILETFDNSFLYNNGKEIRIPIVENGEELQIKAVLTCAKVNVEQGEDAIIPGTIKTGTVEAHQEVLQPTTKAFEPTEEEKRNVSDLLAKLNL
jgi:hypothetical protein